MRMIETMKFTAAALLMASAAVPASAGPTINLIDIGGVTGSPAEQGFKIAAKYWESVLTNNAVVNIEVGFAPLGPHILGSTGSNLAQYIPISAYYSLLGTTGNSALDAQAVANLSPLSGTDSVTVNVPDYLDPATHDGVAASGTRPAPDNTAISATIALSTANFKALVGGYENIVDASIRFSSTFAFDFNPTDGISTGTYDFIGVAVHEMGHALGFLSGADDFNYSVGGGFPVDNYWWGYGMDMFRYSAPGVLDWTFGTSSYLSLDGGATPYQDGYFSTGEDYGDSWQASHWKIPATPCVDLRGIMNPYICNGVADSVTGLDLAMFDAIGWNTNIDVTANPRYTLSTAQMYAAFAVPEPGSLALMIAGFGMMVGVTRRRRRTYVAA